MCCPYFTGFNNYLVPGMQHHVLVGADPWGLPLEEQLLPEYLRNIGYRTRMVGKVSSFLQQIFVSLLGRVFVGWYILHDHLHVHVLTIFFWSPLGSSSCCG
jgi:hypothetical protein